MTADAETKRKTKANLTGRLSKDGLWRSFNKVPNLMQYVPNENYYARIKVHGKVIRRSLETSTFTTAKLKLLDFLREQKGPTPTADEAMTFGKALGLYEQRLADDPAIKPASKEYRLLCVGKLKSTWPSLVNRKVDEITPDECRQWAAKLRVSSHYFNNTIGTLRQIFEVAVREHKACKLKAFETRLGRFPGFA